MSLKSVRWKASLASSSSNTATTDNCFPSHGSKKSSVPNSPLKRCKSSNKSTANGFAVGAKKSPPVSALAPHLANVPTSLPLSVGVRGCALSLPAPPSPPLLPPLSLPRSSHVLATPPTCGATERLSSCVRGLLMLLGPTLCLPRERSRMPTRSCPSGSLLQMIPVTDALAIRERTIRRLWLQGEHANQNARNADQFAAIACNLHSSSALLLPLKAYLPPRCLALPRISPNGTRAPQSVCALGIGGCWAQSPSLVRCCLCGVQRCRVVQDKVSAECAV